MSSVHTYTQKRDQDNYPEWGKKNRHSAEEPSVMQTYKLEKNTLLQ